jgi:hypothetical protein
MKIILMLLVSLLSAIPASAQTRSLELKNTGYQLENGAITVAHQGQFIDPYFAIRALLSAQSAGMDITHAALAYIAWQLPRQEANGLFKRYCLEQNAAPQDSAPQASAQHALPEPTSLWRACADADADDALLAMWIELLYLMAPNQGLPPEWKNSVLSARRQLALIYDKTRGIYVISRSNRVGLLMDNIEIYAALRSTAEQQKRLGLHQLAQKSALQAKQLEQAIQKVFRPARQGDFRISTQVPEASRFYPEQVGQLFAPLFGMTVGQMDAKKSGQHTLSKWLDEHQVAWLAHEKDHFPWGLIALAAEKNEAPDTARLWVERALPLRHGERWNVLEEAIFQALSGNQ